MEEQNIEFNKFLTFDELVQHGLNNGANVVNGMPWSWKINGKSITHENDDLYLIETIKDPAERFERGMIIKVLPNGLRIFTGDPLNAYDGWDFDNI